MRTILSSNTKIEQLLEVELQKKRKLNYSRPELIIEQITESQTVLYLGTELQFFVMGILARKELWIKGA
jgi:hypothetical protein